MTGKVSAYPFMKRTKEPERELRKKRALKKVLRQMSR